MKGRKLKAGDKVNVPCIVKEVSPGAEYCNVTLATAVPMPPYTEPTSIVLNTKQVKKTTAKG
jgi:hypothetical protein